MEDVADIKDLLAPFRARIDCVDDRMIALLSERINIIHEVAAVKKQHHIPAILPDRVLEVIDRNTLNAKKRGLDENMVTALYQIIVSHCCTLEDNLLKTPQENK